MPGSARSALVSLKTVRIQVPASAGDGRRGPVIELVDLGLACCALEVEAALRLGLVTGTDAESVDCHVLLVAGTLTRALSQAVVAAWQQIPAPKAVVAFGACADSGGPYWDAPTVLPGTAPLIPVDLFVPGCPPGPTALVQALSQLGTAR